MNKELLKRCLDGLDEHYTDVCDINLIKDIEDELAKPDPEPVGKKLTENDMGIGFDRKYGEILWFKEIKEGSFLYAEPPAPKELQMLSAFEIGEIYKKMDVLNIDHDIARNIIKAFCEKNGLKLDAPEK